MEKEGKIEGVKGRRREEGRDGLEGSVRGM
jgi:hypothetical protein